MTEPLGAPPRQSVGELLGEVTRDLSNLLHQEVELAKAEARQSAKAAAKGGSMFAGAAVAGHFVLLFLSLALWWALGDAMDSLGWSAVIVAALWAVVAAVLAARGKAESKRVGGMPQTADTVKKIPNALQGHEEKNA
ncbi:phage holin family protein [Cellulomonas fengjieae]|uniref:Phage holin family protein n=1 Tax=Cellulomonas fengjieae TaxID=2819978 RepID=A0ABS3SJ20_9CELL|nr:phage holin family protein [Cellulomonas fengjieae]MBO3085652.1 phage holin family protein [Cellulomonas fengjieae]MBO3102761.1 phage holin family protein [Cellulomonas fengjieae]QVI67633.1 phage holin family protein [Cellulomonas fengjieae]